MRGKDHARRNLYRELGVHPLVSRRFSTREREIIFPEEIDTSDTLPRRTNAVWSLRFFFFLASLIGNAIGGRKKKKKS